MTPVSSASGMKVAGGDQPEARMMPAHQRLEAGDLAADMGLRLVMQIEFLARDRAAQVLLQRAPLAQLLVHRQLEEAHRAARFRFGAEQRGVGIGEQRDRVGAVLREYGDADGQADPRRIAVDLDIVVERRTEALGEPLGNFGLRAGRRDDGELVAADAGQEGALAHRLQPARDFAQQRIAGGMAEHVVHRFEAVEIEAQHGEALARARRQLHGGSDAFVEGRAIGQLGERIVMRHVRDALLVALAVGEVAHDADEVLRFAVVAIDRYPRVGDDAGAVARGRHRVLVAEDDGAGGDQSTVLLFDLPGGGRRHDVDGALAEHGGAVDAEILLGGAVDQQIAQVLRALHDDRRRHVLDDRVEKRAGLLQLALGELVLR